MDNVPIVVLDVYNFFDVYNNFFVVHADIHFRFRLNGPLE
jgi:hypothetical protein